MASKNTAEICFEKQIRDAACVLRGNVVNPNIRMSLWG